MYWAVLAWIVLLLAGYVAATLSGAAGFGGALLLLPVAAWAVGPREAVPLLTLAQLAGNLSRAGFGWREIQWRPVGLFCLGAAPAALAGALLFVRLPSEAVLRGVGIFLLAMVALRRTKVGRRPLPEAALAPGGAAVGFLSAVAGSAGTLGALLFLGLGLPAGAYVATEAVTAVAMHLVKAGVYSRFSLLTGPVLGVGALLSGAMVAGSWTGKRLIETLPRERFELLVEALLVVSAVSLVGWAR